MKRTANYLTILRICLSITLVFVKPLGIPFFMIYFACGISDVLDGFIARKTNTASKFGARLDSIADFIMVTVLIILLYPIVDLSSDIVFWIVVIAVIRIVSICIAYIKHKTLAMLHTYANKLTGLLLFTFPFFINSQILLYIICIVATVSASEELLIQLSSKKLDMNRKSILSGGKNIIY